MKTEIADSETAVTGGAEEEARARERARGRREGEKECVGAWARASGRVQRKIATDATHMQNAKKLSRCE